MLSEVGKLRMDRDPKCAYLGSISILSSATFHRYRSQTRRFYPQPPNMSMRSDGRQYPTLRVPGVDIPATPPWPTTPHALPCKSRPTPHLDTRMKLVRRALENRAWIMLRVGPENQEHLKGKKRLIIKNDSFDRGPFTQDTLVRIGAGMQEQVNKKTIRLWWHQRLAKVLPPSAGVRGNYVHKAERAERCGQGIGKSTGGGRNERNHEEERKKEEDGGSHLHQTWLSFETSRAYAPSPDLSRATPRILPIL